MYYTFCALKGWEFMPHSEFHLFIYIFNHFIIVLLQLSQFFPLCPPLPTSHPAPTVNSHTIVHVHGSFIHVLWLVSSHSFHHFPPPPSLLVTFSLIYVSMPVVLFCTLVYFVLDSTFRWDHGIYYDIKITCPPLCS